MGRFPPAWHNTLAQYAKHKCRSRSPSVKLPMKKLLSLSVAVGAIALLSGCGSTGFTSVRDVFFKPRVSQVQEPATIRTNTVLVTNVIEVLKTNEVSGEITRLTKINVTPEERVEFLPPRVVFVTNGWEKNEAVFGAMQAGAGFIPGWGSVIAAAIGGIGTAAAAWMSKRKTTHGLVGTIQGIDEFRRGLQGTEQGRALDAELTRLLSRAQVDWGSVELIKRMLEEHTGYTKDQGKVAELLATKSQA
jgi:hypothetical protein